MSRRPRRGRRLPKKVPAAARRRPFSHLLASGVWRGVAGGLFNLTCEGVGTLLQTKDSTDASLETYLFTSVVNPRRTRDK